MRDETLRMERVTYREQGVACLENFSMTIFAGEIQGLVPVNHYGLEALIKLLRHNLPLHYGYIYYRDRMVNSWQKPGSGINKISVIRSKSCLAEGLTVADNIFVLRPGFKKRLMQPKVLEQQLLPFLEEIGMDIPGSAYVEELGLFERFVVELLKAVVAGSRLVVLEDIGTFVSDAELGKLHEILRYYAGKGMAFLYITAHYEETRQICHRTGLMLNGQITKYFAACDEGSDSFFFPCMEDYDRWVRQQFHAFRTPSPPCPAFRAEAVYSENLTGLDFRVNPGECLVLQDLDNCVFPEFIELLSGRKPDGGRLLAAGEPLRGRMDRRIAVIQELPVETMLFHSMSYLDNLCFTVDKRMKHVWDRKQIKKSLRREYADFLGQDVFDKPVEQLTREQMYDLIYTRIYLQNPEVVFCAQPFKQAEMSLRVHIWKLMERFLNRGAAVVILAVNLADSLALADRLVRIRDGRVLDSLDKEEFVKLPVCTPWRYLYQEKFDNPQD